MAQTRYWNFKADDATADINRWMTGVHPPGLYFGFDFSATANLILNLVHTSTGFKDVDNTPAESNFIGILLTRQGVIIKEDAAIVVGAVAVGHATLNRIDVVVVSHSINEVAGGSQALYSIIQGTPGATPVAPALTSPTTQTKIGELYIPATTTVLTGTGVKFTREGKPGFGDTQFALPAQNDLNDLNKNGYYVTSGTPLNRPISSNGGIINIVYDSSGSPVRGAQIYIVQATSRMFFRNKQSLTSWDAWVELTSPTSSITGAITTVLTSDLNNNIVVVTNGSGKIVNSTTTVTKLGFINNLSSDAQTQIDGKEDTVTGAITTVLTSNLSNNVVVVTNGSGKVVSGAVTTTELGVLAGVTGITSTNLNHLSGSSSNIQTQINGKQATITGAITTVLSSNLSNNIVVISNGSGKIISSSVTATELTVLSGASASLNSTKLNYLVGMFEPINTALGRKFSYDQNAYSDDLDTFGLGIQMAEDSAPNAPLATAGVFFMVLTMPGVSAGVHVNGERTQVALQTQGAGAGDIYVRTRATLLGAWSGWTTANT